MSKEFLEVGYQRDPSGLFVPTDPTLVVGGPAPRVTEKRFEEVAAELNQSWGIHRDPKYPRTGQRFDIGVANADQADKGTVLVIMTSNGGILVNPGNGAEEIAAAIASGARRVIVNDTGVGGTDSFPLEDLLYYAVSGRRTDGIGTKKRPYKPMGSYEALARVLASRDLMPTHISTSNEAASGGLGAAMAFDPGPGTLKEILLSNPRGFKHTGAQNLSMALTDAKDRLTARFGENDPWAITDELKQHTKSLLPDIYKGDTHSWVQGSHSRALWNLAIHGLSRAGKSRKDPNNPLRHSMIQDILAVYSRHDINISINANIDSSHIDMATAIVCGQVIMNLLSEKRQTDGRLVWQFSPGGHDRHTAKPQERWFDERRAFTSIIRNIVGQSTGGASAPGTVSPLRPAAEDARKEAS